MPKLSERALALQQSAIRALERSVAQHPDVDFARINIGQPDLHTPAPMLDVIASWGPDTIAYGPSSGTQAAREAAASYTRRWSPDLSVEDVAITTGGSEALHFACQLLCDAGDDVLVPEPFYPNYRTFLASAGATLRPIQTRLDDGFALPDDAALDALVGPRTRAILLSNPGNPTGAVYGAAEIERLVSWARRRDLFVISDEVYRRIWFDEPAPSALSFHAGRDHVLAVDSLSKTWSACGLRLGTLVSRNRALMERAERLGQARLGPQPLAQAVAIAAWELPESYYEEIRNIWKARVQTLMEAVAQIPGVKAPTPAGAFYTMLDLPVADSDAFARFLVNDFRMQGRSVVVAPGGGFYADPERGRTQIRVAAVLEPARLRSAIELIGAGLEAYAARS